MGNIVLIGAGGTGMSGLAMLLQELGYNNLIAINDVENQLTQRLRERRLKLIIGHGLYQVQRDDFVIYSDVPGIIAGPEITQSRLYQQAPSKKHFHICLSYNEMIAEISKRFLTIAVSGSNGKSSTTGMLIHLLHNLPHPSSHSELTPETGKGIAKGMRGNEGEVNGEGVRLACGILGALMPQYDNQGYLLNSSILSDIKHLFDHIFNQKHQLNYDLLKKYIFVIEACEYKNHFLSYDIDYSLITNIEHDHSDFFKTVESYNDAFRHFIVQTKKKVILTATAAETLGHERLDHHARDKYIISQPYDFQSDYLIGSYHQSNAGMIVSLLQEMQSSKFKTHDRDDVLSQRKGLGRRMECIHTSPSGTKVYSDYSHHAPAILGNMQAIHKQFPNHRIITIFQPHQAQRVLAGRDDFREALALSDETIIYKLYTAREDFHDLQQRYPLLQGISSFDEFGEKFAEHVKGEYITSLDDIMTLIQKNYQQPTLIVIFSAGDLDYSVRNAIV